MEIYIFVMNELILKGWESGFEQVKGPCIEKNFWDDKNPGEYKCEVWIPVKLNNF